MTIVYALQGDTLDSVCYRYYGYTAGVVEQVLEANPHLADFPVLPMGTAVTMPVILTPQPQTALVQLWD